MDFNHLNEIVQFSPWGGPSACVYTLTPICQKNKGPETLTHFLFECDEHYCRHIIKQAQQVLVISIIAYPEITTESYEWYAQIVFDSSHHHTDEESINRINVINMQYIFHRHNMRPGETDLGSQYARARCIKTY